jgi:hypothetical protein
MVNDHDYSNGPVRNQISSGFSRNFIITDPFESIGRLETSDSSVSGTEIRNNEAQESHFKSLHVLECCILMRPVHQFIIKKY